MANQAYVLFASCARIACDAHKVVVGVVLVSADVFKHLFTLEYAWNSLHSITSITELAKRTMTTQKRRRRSTYR